MKATFVWKIPLKATPARLWRYIADTNRINQYAGLPEFTFHYLPEPGGGSRQIGETRYMGWRLRWEEHPFEWIEGRYFEVLRSYYNGPIREFRTSVRLHSQEGGTLVEQTLECQPRWGFALPAIYWEIGVTSRRRFLRAYRKIEQLLEGKSDAPRTPVPRQPIAPGRLEIIRERIAGAAGREFLPNLIQDIETLQDDELDRMRPFVFADRWNADRRETLKLFLHASQAGLLDLSWDVICPGCRGAPERYATLRNLRKDAHCPACNIRYTADFAESVEITFRPNALIRRVDVARYCSGGPMNAPHVVIRQSLKQGESRTVDVRLSPWKYRIRSSRLEEKTPLLVTAGAKQTEATIRIHRTAIESDSLEMRPDFRLTLENLDDQPFVISIERDAGDEQAATAAMVIAMQEFRSLFSAEVLSPDDPISVGAVTLMFTDLKESTMLYESIGEAPAYGLVRRHFDLLRDNISAADGAIVKTIGDAVMAAFLDPAKAVEAAFAIHRSIRDDNARRGDPALIVRIGVHHGPCIAVNQNEALDYFGTTVNLAARIQKESQGGDVAITDELWRDPRVQELLNQRPHTVVSRECAVRGLSGSWVVHVISE